MSHDIISTATPVQPDLSKVKAFIEAQRARARQTVRQQREYLALPMTDDELACTTFLLDLPLDDPRRQVIYGADAADQLSHISGWQPTYNRSGLPMATPRKRKEVAA